MGQPRIVFAGTPEFALTTLKALVEADKAPVAVLTQPDRPAGRGKRLKASPVKRYADACGITVLQPVTLRDDAVAAEFAAFKPDVLVVAAYGLILPQRVLDIPAHGCINVHASLLPRWRGAAPIQAAILAGDAETGVCLMQMTAGLDCGPVYTCTALRIGSAETAGELHDRLAALGAQLLVRHLGDIVAGRMRAQEQDESRATYAAKIRREAARIDWQRPAAELERHVRAFNPVPGAYFPHDGDAIKCWRAEVVSGIAAEPGRVVTTGKGGIVVACGVDGVRLTRLQRPGRRPVTGAEFAAQLDLTGRTL